MTVKELYGKYGAKRGFTKEEIKEFDQVCGWCANFDTSDDEEYQTRLFNMIDLIIHDNRFDYLSKLDKINFLVSLNKTWRKWSERVLNCRQYENVED